MMRVGLRRRQGLVVALALAGALFAACASPAGQGGAGGNGAAGSMTGGAPGNGGDTGGLKLATGGPFPFPQHKTSGSCMLTSAAGADSAARGAYNAWLASFVTSSGAGTGNLRVQRPTNQNDTVSEGIGYGMIAAA